MKTKTIKTTRFIAVNGERSIWTIGLQRNEVIKHLEHQEAREWKGDMENYMQIVKAELVYTIKVKS